MEDEKLAAYYDELSRKGSGAAKFKQGLGFSSQNDDVPIRGSALPTTSSFLSSFVKASSSSNPCSETTTNSSSSKLEKKAQLQSIQNKLSTKPKDKRVRSRSRSRSPSRDRNRRDNNVRSRSRSRSRERRSSRRRNRSRERRSRSRDSYSRSRRNVSPDKGKDGIDFTKSIKGYDTMVTPAERVRAKMKLQLSQTVENDGAIGKGSGWERFEFNKDAPLDDNDEIEAAEDDAALVKNMGQTFRFSAVEARKEEQIKMNHDEAIFGGSSYPPPAATDDEAEEETHSEENVKNAPAISLLSDQVLTMKQGSWRDRARKA